ncbi:MAG: HDOD domain-containing protein [Proteobacteria bacterium]|nr:HDOD domain-containing protein [Pseudomonadota bacterium]MBU1688051.1 HDOD domain-containing protein [Pseudomonadota bacterium]
MDKSPEVLRAEKLADIFSRINLSELPAMSAHVHELISVTCSSRSASYELAKIILKDYSLTNKVLQVVNSAYYALGQKVSSISRAVTILGFDAVRDLATGIALFEDFIERGVEKEGITKVLAKSFLSALQARDMVESRNLRVSPEVAFICALLHNLGRIIICIYLPEKFREIEREIESGLSERAAAAKILDGVTFVLIGQEVARFWNLSDKVVESMECGTAEAGQAGDEMTILRNVSGFTNKLVDRICDGQDLAPLLARYGVLLQVDRKSALALMNKSIEASEDLSDSMRYGLAKLKIRSRLRTIEQEKNDSSPKPGTDPAGTSQSPPPLPVSRDKSLNDFIRDITEILVGEFQLNDFYLNLLEGLYRGIGFDRVILAIVSIKPQGKILQGRFGLGDITPEQIEEFQFPLSVDHLFASAVVENRDKGMTIGPSVSLPEPLRSLVVNRRIHLLPITLRKSPIGLIYLDRLSLRADLEQEQLRSARLLRDMAVMALRKIMERKERKR